MRGNKLRIQVNIPQITWQNTIKAFDAQTTRIASLLHCQASGGGPWRSNGRKGWNATKTAEEKRAYHKWVTGADLRI